MAEKPSVKQILEIYYALRAAGVQRLPKPLPRATHRSGGSGATLFLYDFWIPATTQETAPPILRRLTERLAWGGNVQLCAAVEGQPKSPQCDPVDEAAVARLRARLEEGSVNRIACFGWRAAHVLSVVVGQPYTIPSEAFEPLLCEADGLGPLEILVLPDVRELEAFPEWRARVWESLVSFAQK